MSRGRRRPGRQRQLSSARRAEIHAGGPSGASQRLRTATQASHGLDPWQSKKLKSTHSSAPTPATPAVASAAEATSAAAAAAAEAEATAEAAGAKPGARSPRRDEVVKPCGRRRRGRFAKGRGRRAETLF